jgi:starch phosphorylase
MKVLVNGGINLSELDGWWAEAYCPEVGWALGDGKEHGEDPLWDAAEAEALYKLLEDEVIPEFYQRDANGIPKAWVTRMKESMARLTPHFSANRAVREYTEKYYIPAAAAFRKRSGSSGETGIEIAKWQREIEQKWNSLRFGEVIIKTDGDRHLFEVQVYLNGLNPDYVHVELYAAKTDDQKPVVQETIRVRQLVGAENGFVYGASLPATRPVNDYTARIVPYHPDVVVPLEARQILWQR